MKKNVLAVGALGDQAGRDFLDVVSQRRGTELVREIPLGEIRLGDNVRTQASDVTDLAASIREQGLLQPVVVVPIRLPQESRADEVETIDETSGVPKYLLVFGHRRLRAYQILEAQEPGKWGVIRAIVAPVGAYDEQTIRVVQLIENIQRQDLAPMELSEGLALLREQGLTAREIAKRIGKSEGYVKNLFAAALTLEENKEVADIVASNAGVTLGDIQEVRPLGAREQAEVLREKADGRIGTRAALRNRVATLRADMRGGEPVNPPKVDDDFFEPRPSTPAPNQNVVWNEKDGGFYLHECVWDPQKNSQADLENFRLSLRELLARLDIVAIKTTNTYQKDVR
jgi:ParB family chromosome partitioning protein